MEQNPQVKTTPAIAHLREKNIIFTECPFAYVDKGGTAHSSHALGVAEHAVIKTLIFEKTEASKTAASGTLKTPCQSHCVVLMHGDLNVDTKKLALAVGSRRAFPCEPMKACELTGYQLGGTSPFGLKTALPVFAEASIQNLDQLWINGGARGLLVRITPHDLVRAIPLEWVNVGKSR